MAFDVRWGGIGVGYNFGGLLITGDPVDFTIDWRDGPKERFRKYNRDFDGDGFNEQLYAGHEFSRGGSYSVIVRHNVEGLPVIRMHMLLAAEAEERLTGLISNRDDLVVATRFDDQFGTADGDDFVTGGDGNDSIDAGKGDDTIFGGRDNDTISGRAGNDYLQGDEGDDLLMGYEGNDTLYANGGNDTLRGNDGFDRLDGGAGIDLMTGGADADIFVFAPAQPWDEPEAPRGDLTIDTITDYNQIEDRLDVSGWGDLTFIGKNAFSGEGRELRFVELGRGTSVFGDIDGDSVADFSFYIRQNATLTPDDFIGGNVTMAG